MNIELIAFTEAGLRLGERVASALAAQGDGARLACGFGEKKTDFRAWTARGFDGADALVFVGAAGIAVRAVAPHVQSKAGDPAVLVLDEGGRFVVPILSGHIGGGNRLARCIAALLGAQPVLTTATDVRGVFAVDDWAVSQGLAIVNPACIKPVSARRLRGETVRIKSDAPLRGATPDGVALTQADDYDVLISHGASCRAGALHLVPRCLVLGVGCRKGVAVETVEAVLAEFLARHDVSPLALCGVYSIALKAREEALLRLCTRFKLPFETYSAQELNALPGEFSASDFVRGVAGVDNVCERSAVLGSGGGALVARKYAKNGVTMALAMRAVCYDLGGNLDG